jgi:tagatose-6-phosphate ketose/aldose isomerase
MSGQLTWSEIKQQADLWPETLETVRKTSVDHSVATVVTGAGTSAYAAAAVASALPNAQPVPSTDLLTEKLHPYRNIQLLVSLARSGNSPESVAVVKRLRRELPNIRHLAITCNADGQLAKLDGVQTITLDPRTNDRSLVMTSSFSNLVLAGAASPNLALFERELPAICERFRKSLPVLHETAVKVASKDPSRVVFLGSGPLLAGAKEGALKVLEMTAGQVVTVAETFLGLRHGPMSFLRGDTVVVCFLSSDPLKRQYEEDLIRELRAKHLGLIVGLTPDPDTAGPLHEYLPATAPNLPDELRIPFEIVFAQVLGFELSLRLGLDPDNPSPDAVITRVVQSFQIHHND